MFLEPEHTRRSTRIHGFTRTMSIRFRHNGGPERKAPGFTGNGTTSGGTQKELNNAPVERFRKKGGYDHGRL